MHFFVGKTASWLLRLLSCNNEATASQQVYAGKVWMENYGSAHEAQSWAHGSRTEHWLSESGRVTKWRRLRGNLKDQSTDSVTDMKNSILYCMEREINTHWYHAAAWSRKQHNIENQGQGNWRPQIWHCRCVLTLFDTILKCWVNYFPEVIYIDWILLLILVQHSHWDKACYSV